MSYSDYMNGVNLKLTRIGNPEWHINYLRDELTNAVNELERRGQEIIRLETRCQELENCLKSLKNHVQTNDSTIETIMQNNAQASKLTETLTTKFCEIANLLNVPTDQ